jgi:hypothetical protein
MPAARTEVTRRVRVAEAAVAVLRETDNPAVMWGDCGLLDLIAERAGMERDSSKWMGGIPDRHTRVLNALSRRPGDLVPSFTLTGRGRRVRVFWLPEHAPSST